MLTSDFVNPLLQSIPFILQICNAIFKLPIKTVEKKQKNSGIDNNLSSLVTVFDGKTAFKVDPIKPTQKYAKRLKKRQQKLSRRVQGSNNGRKAIQIVAKVRDKIANTRQDFLDKLSRKLVDENQIIVAAGLSMLLNLLTYKLEREAGKFVQVDRFYASTKTCSCCGFKNDLINLSVRDWVCPSCQTHHNRDINTAKNIRAEGLILSTNTVGHAEFQACGETVRLINTCIKKQVSVNQKSPATLPDSIRGESVNLIILKNFGADGKKVFIPIISSAFKLKSVEFFNSLLPSDFMIEAR